jgi:hypothetical protein
MQWKNSGGSWANLIASDRRLKRDISDLPEDYGLAAIGQLKPVSFRWKDAEKDRDEGGQMGLIAQDVEDVFSTGGLTYNFGDVTMDLGGGDRETVRQARGLNYDRLVVPLIKAVQEQEAELDAKDNKMALLKKDIANLNAALGR